MDGITNKCNDRLACVGVVYPSCSGINVRDGIGCLVCWSVLQAHTPMQATCMWPDLGTGSQLGNCTLFPIA
jgi:hypothetical protein